MLGLREIHRFQEVGLSRCLHPLQPLHLVPRFSSVNGAELSSQSKSCIKGVRPRTAAECLVQSKRCRMLATLITTDLFHYSRLESLPAFIKRETSRDPPVFHSSHFPIHPSSWKEYIQALQLLAEHSAEISFPQPQSYRDGLGKGPDDSAGACKVTDHSFSTLLCS